MSLPSQSQRANADENYPGNDDVEEFHAEARENLQHYHTSPGTEDVYIDVDLGVSVMVPRWLHAVIFHLIAVDEHAQPRGVLTDPMHPRRVQAELRERLHLRVAGEVLVAARRAFLLSAVDVQEAWRNVDPEVHIPAREDIPVEWREVADDAGPDMADPTYARLERERRRLLYGEDVVDAHRASPPPDPSLTRAERVYRLRERLGRASEYEERRAEENLNELIRRVTVKLGRMSHSPNEQEQDDQSADQLGQTLEASIPDADLFLDVILSDDDDDQPVRQQTPLLVNTEFPRETSPTWPIPDHDQPFNEIIEGAFPEMIYGPMDPMVYDPVLPQFQPLDDTPDPLDLFSVGRDIWGRPVSTLPKEQRGPFAIDSDDFLNIRSLPPVTIDQVNYESLMYPAQSVVPLPPPAAQSPSPPPTQRQPKKQRKRQAQRTPSKPTPSRPTPSKPTPPKPRWGPYPTTTATGRPVRRSARTTPHQPPMPAPATPPPTQRRRLILNVSQRSAAAEAEAAAAARSPLSTPTRKAAPTPPPTLPSSARRSSRIAATRRTSIPASPTPLPLPPTSSRQRATTNPSRQSTVLLPPTIPQTSTAAAVGNIQTGPNGVVTGPNGIILRRTHNLPGMPVTLPSNASPAQIAFFRSIWQPGEHVPDHTPNHVFVCRYPGCGGRIRYKRDLVRHYANLHDIIAVDLNAELPHRARREGYKHILVDDQGVDLPDSQQRWPVRGRQRQQRGGNNGHDDVDDDNGDHTDGDGDGDDDDSSDDII